MGTFVGSFKNQGSIASNAMVAFTQKFFICICFFLLINQLPVSEAGPRSIDACDGKAEGDVCIKPACAEDAPPAWCQNETCRCKECPSGTLYCKSPERDDSRIG